MKYVYLDLTVERHMLRRGYKTVRLSRQHLKLALLLLEARGVPLKAKQIADHMWPLSTGHKEKMNRLGIVMAKFRRAIYPLGLTVVFELYKGYHLTDKLHVVVERLQRHHCTHINIHCSKALKLAIDMEAQRRGLSKSDLMRFILAKALGVKERPAKIGGDHCSALFRDANRELSA